MYSHLIHRLSLCWSHPSFLHWLRFNVVYAAQQKMQSACPCPLMQRHIRSSFNRWLLEYTPILLDSGPSSHCETWCPSTSLLLLSIDVLILVGSSVSFASYSSPFCASTCVIRITTPQVLSMSPQKHFGKRIHRRHGAAPAFENEIVQHGNIISHEISAVKSIECEHSAGLILETWTVSVQYADVVTLFCIFYIYCI